MSHRLFFLKLLCVAAITFSTTIAFAHFNSGETTRQFVLTEHDKTTEVFVRTPLTLLFSDITGGGKNNHGFLMDHGENSDPRWYLVPTEINNSRQAFTKRLADSLHWQANRLDVASRVRSWRLLPMEPEQKLYGKATALNSLKGASWQDPVAIERGYIDMHISVSAGSHNGKLLLGEGDTFLGANVDMSLDNHFIDERTDSKRIYSRAGVLTPLISLPRTRFDWLVEYIYQGAHHIAIGIDHVMLVIVMALSSYTRLGLFLAVSAFTIGHGLTLLAGFFGYAPSGTWFIPTIELSIAASVLFSATTNLSRSTSPPPHMYAAIGLIHGFGFSAVLGDVLGRDSLDLKLALSAFMLGIEIGQLIIIGIVMSLFWATYKASQIFGDFMRRIILILLSLVSLTMVVERIPHLVDAIR